MAFAHFSDALHFAHIVAAEAAEFVTYRVDTATVQNSTASFCDLFDFTYVITAKSAQAGADCAYALRIDSAADAGDAANFALVVTTEAAELFTNRIDT